LTPSAPTWGDVEDFLLADGWRRLGKGERGGGRDRHVFYEKVLEEGRVLQTHVSHSRGKTISPGRFAGMLRHQLEVSRDEFWECIRTRAPVERPAAVEELQVEHESWVVNVLAGELHLTAEQIGALSPEDALRRVNEHWSKET
jgi:hypothetical protein